MVVEEGARGGAAGAVDGGVLDARKADGLGDGAEERRERRVTRARGLEDIEMHAVALVDGVGVVAALALDAPDAGEAVERLWVVEAARGVAEDAGAELLHAPEREAPALDGGGGAAKASGAVTERTGGEVGGAALDLVEVDAGAVPDDVRDVIGVEVRVPLTRICLAGRRTVALVAEGDGDAVGGGGGEGGEDGVEGGVVAGRGVGGVDGGVAEAVSPRRSACVTTSP